MLREPAMKPTKTTDDANQPSGEPNEGEGSRTAARRYNDATTAYPEWKAKEAAERAKQAISGDEGKALADAEAEARGKASDIELDKDIPEDLADLPEEDEG